MTDLRTAAQQALEAWDTRAGIDTASRAFEALRAALAEPVQEERAVCDECGKHKRDGWALYCVDCVEPVFALSQPPDSKHAKEKA